MHSGDRKAACVYVLVNSLVEKYNLCLFLKYLKCI